MAKKTTKKAAKKTAKKTTKKAAKKVAKKTTKKAAKKTAKKTTKKKTTKKKTTKKAASKKKVELTFDMISERAKQVWERKGMPQGLDDENWAEAEAELKAELGL